MHESTDGVPLGFLPVGVLLYMCGVLSIIFLPSRLILTLYSKTIETVALDKIVALVDGYREKALKPSVARISGLQKALR